MEDVRESSCDNIRFRPEYRIDYFTEKLSVSHPRGSRRHLISWFPKLAVMTTMVSVCGFSIGSQAKPASGQAAADHAVQRTALPQVFNSVLPQLKAGSHIPILLPTELPRSIEAAKQAVVEKAEANEYGISLYADLSVGMASFAASFSAQAKPEYHPRELPNVQTIKMAHDIVGFFRAVSCGGSCAPANLWWEQDGVLYQIQLKLSPLLSEQKQEKTILTVANSSILAGPR
jgi:hypothetical protein